MQSCMKQWLVQKNCNCGLTVKWEEMDQCEISLFCATEYCLFPSQIICGSMCEITETTKKMSIWGIEEKRRFIKTARSMCMKKVTFYIFYKYCHRLSSGEDKFIYKYETYDSCDWKRWSQMKKNPVRKSRKNKTTKKYIKKVPSKMYTRLFRLKKIPLLCNSSDIFSYLR